MKPELKKQLKLAAVDIRKGIMTSTHAAKSGHPGGSLSCADVVAYLYFHEMRIKPEEPEWPERDRFVLSKGHAAPAVYSALALRGYFPEEELLTLRKSGSPLQGHPNMRLTRGIDMSTGSLGQGLSAAAGMAKGAKYLNKDINIYALCGDGEMNEGIIWEALAFASHYHLDNLCIMVDMNGLQIDGKTADVLNMQPMDEKLKAFGCHVHHIEGHDFESLETGFSLFHEHHGTGMPTALLLSTEKGKGVAYMESEAGWHGKAPNDMQYKIAMAELDAHRMALEVL